MTKRTKRILAMMSSKPKLRKISGLPPLTYTAKEGTLKNYRIYGNTVDGGSVGDFVTDGDHAGEYKVFVTINDVTTNLYLPEPLKMVGDEAEYIDYVEQKQHRVRKNLAKNNHAKSSTMFTVEEVNNFIHVSGTNNTGSVKPYIISKENTFPAGSYDIVNNSDTSISYDYKDKNGALVYEAVNANSIKTFNFPAAFTRHLNIYKAVPNGESIDNYFRVMIVKHGDDTDTYEPYIENTELDVTLPALPTLVGTNVLSVGTEVPPSEVMVTGKINNQ